LFPWVTAEGAVAGPLPFQQERDKDPRLANEVSLDFVVLTSGGTRFKSGWCNNRSHSVAAAPLLAFYETNGASLKRLPRLKKIFSSAL